MPEEKDKIKKLYDTFVSDGYDMESEEDFRKNLLDSTKRKAAYDALVKDGYDMEPFEEFESNIGFGKERTSSQQSGNSASGTVEEPISPANEQTWRPTEKEKVAMLTETDRIMNDVKSHTQTFNERIDNMQEYGINPGLQTKEGKMIFNPESGKLEKTFLTPAGNRYYSKSLADMESFQYRQAADMSIGGQLRKANLRLQELKAKQEERASEVHKEWAEETENNKAPLAAILGAATYTPRQQSDKENRALSVAIRETEELIKNLEEQKDRENGVDVGFWRGFGRTMGDVRTWDFGMGDMRDAFTMMNADELKKENATEGEREAHDAMMGAIHEKQQAEERYSGNADFWNRAGVMTGYMPSFMLDFVLTGGGFNGLSSFSKGSTRLATKVISKETAEKMAQQGFKSYIKENGAKGLGRYATDWTIKALGTTADDLLVRAPLMANTVQAGKTTADIIDRKLGDVVVDENGNYDFSNDKTWGDAIWQSEANAIIENYSEMFGAHLDPVFTLGNMSKLANVVGAKRIGAVLSKADASALNGIMGQTHQMFNKMGMSDYVGEVSEEYYGQLWRTMLNLDDAYQQNPDGTRTNLFASGQFHGDIWGGMALSMGLMGAGKHTLSAANYTSMKHGVNKADAKVNELLGKEVWEPLKATLDLTTNENIGEVAELIAGDKDFTINEKAAVLDYMERSLNLRGFNLASMAQSRGGNRNESVQQANDSYLDGYNIISSQEMNDAKNMYEYQRARVADLVDESMFAMIEENPIATLEFVNGNEQWNDEDKVSVIDYINAKQVYNGMIQRVRDDIDGRIEQSNSMIDARVNRNTGMIQGATMKQDERKVYVISGKLVPYDDGSGVSVTDSDNSIIIRDSETGALEQVSPDAVLSLDESQDPNEQKELAEQAIVEQFAREAADKIDGKVTFNPGDAYTITGQDGSQMQVQIIANEDGIVDNGDGTVNVSDGVNIFPLAKETIQQQADAANLARVAQFEQQRTIENAERKQEMQEAERPQYALNDIVSLTDENGVTVRGNITADADADGKYEVFTEAPINGKRVNLFTRDELDNMLLEHNGVAFERPVENESNNGAENIPENDNNAPQNIPAMQRIPKDEQGNPLYEQADSDTAWDAIVEQTEGDEDMAQTVADGMVADKEEALKKLEKAKSKGGNSIAEKIASEKERKAAIDAAKQELLVWQKIAGTAKRRKMEADDERRRIADEAAALRKAEEEKLRAEREEAERIEREALNGVPDMVDDKPQDARARGYRRMNGHKIDRQEPVQALQGKEVSVKFSDDAIVGGRVAVIDVNLLQPSHIQGVRNPLHFIDEAQPKERNDEASVLSARKIAGNIRPEEITSSVTAYTGAPTVNARGEAIQGNNRSDALRIMWENHPEQAALYKQYLKDHAEEFGLQAEDIEAMEHPVLVNMVDVDDAEAIRLGQYVAQDTESGGVERIKPKNALQRMGAEMRSFANLLLRTSDDEMSFAGLVDSNGANVLKWMSQRGFITPTQYKSAFDSKGNLTPESKNDLRGIMYQSIFKDGSTRLEEMFNVLPVKAQKAILATAFRDYDSPNSERMVDEIQNSVRAYYALSQDKMFAEAKNFKEARTAVESWKRQYQMDDVTGESYLPADKFSNFVLHLAAMYKGESQSFIQNTFGKIYDLIQGTQEETLFEQPDNTPRTLVQAIKETFNLDYNGQQRSNVLVGDTATSQRGQQGSNGTLAPRERVENRNGTTDDTGRTESIGGQSEIESSLSQEEMLFSDDTDNQLSAKIARRIEVQEDDWIESGKYGDTYKQTIIVDGTHKVIKVDAPDTKGNYIGSAYEYDGQTFGDLLDVLNYIDASLSLANAVAVAEKETDTTPTEKQKEAGNYKKGHVQVGTFNITIENPKGSVRSGIDTEGNKWETIMQNTYGYIRGTEGVDGDHIDVFLSDDIDGWNGRRVFVVDQYNEDGSFDEHKVMLGFNETDDAEAAYFANYDSDWANNHKTVVTAVNLEDFEKWIDSSHRKTKAFAEYKSVKSVEEQSSSTQVDRLSEIKSRIEELHKEQEAAHGQSDIFEEARIISEINDLFTEQRKLEQNNSNEETTTPTDAAYTITQAQYTTKRGKVLDMHLVKFNNKLRDTVRKHTTMFAKQLKGWWDKEKQGFMMRSKEDAERLAEYATDAQSQPPLSLSDLSEVNDGNVQFSEPQQQKATKQEEKQEYTPIWQYSVFVDKETGETTLSRDDVSGPIPIGDARFRQTTNSPEEMLDILRNPQNGMQEVLDAVGISLENKIKTRELDRKAKDEIRDKRTDFVVDKEMDNRYSVRTLMKMIDAEKQAVMDLGEKRGGDVYHEGNIIFLTKDSADKFANEVRTLINDMRSEQQQDNSQKKTEASGNRLVTDERYAELRERMRKKLLGQMNIGIDPEILAIGTEMAVYHLEKGSRKFAEYATAMIADLGDAIRPYLKAFYNGARDLPEVAENGLDADMTPYDEVQQFDVANFDKKSIDALATAETVTRETEVEQEAEIAQERIKKSRPARKKNEKKAVNSQQSNELGLFDDLIDNNKNNEHGLQRTDAERSEGLSANGNRHGQGLSRGTETGSESEQQAGRGTDNEGERTSDAVNRIVRPRLSDAITEKKNTHNNHSERGKDHAPTSVDARIEANIKAIELAKQLLESGERATEKQMQTLRKFSGWGGLGKAFNEGTSYAPNPIAKKLRELLGEKAYQEAVMSANSAYYTPAYVVDTLWDIAEQMGFNGGNILEGSAGIGNILGQMPTNISERSDIHAIEIDGTSGGILSLLYPDAKVEIQGFEQTRIPNGSVDLAITNVPFVTGLRVNDTTGDKDLSKKFHNIHDFCIAKNVRKLREGGLGIFITSNGTLDNSKKLRDWIVSEGGADFVGAFRMHNKTFGGTGVTSDIVVIRKRVNEQKSAHAIDVSDVSGERMAEYDTGETRKVKGKETPVIKQLSMDYNRYFIEHPENMAGEMHFAFEKGDTFRPTSKGLYPKQDKKQEEMLAEFVRSFRAEEFARRERQRMAERVESLAEKLHLDNVEVVTDASVLDGKKQRAKGFYSKSTGKITIVIPNHTSTFDVEQTLLHEAVAHYGLRQLFGEHFDTFLDNVFNNADENIRRRIVDMAAKNGWDFHKATEEYLASLAEDTEFENINASWWQQIKDFFLNMLHKIGFEDFRGVTLSDNELRYILWRSYENLAEPGRYRNILGEAADVAKQYELKVGNYAVSDPHHLTVAESDDALYRTGDPEIHERELARDRYERRVKSGMFQSREALQDSMLGLKEAMTAILGKETNIEDVDGFENAYLGENRLSSVNKAEADAFAHTLFKPMLDEVAKLARTEAEREELTDYMMAKHGLERNTYMRNEAINNGATDADQTDYAGLTALTGMDNITDAETEAQIMVNDYEQAHDTTDLWKKVNAASKAILSKSYECGMMSKATFDKISDMYDFYIPLRGFDEKTSSEAYAYLTHKQSAFNAPIKKAEGRRSKADDPFANLQSMAEGAIMQGNRNKLVKQRFLNFALNHSSDLVSVSDIWVEYDTVADEWKPVFPDNIDSTDTPEVVERKMLDFETKMESLAQQYPDRYKHGKDTVNIPYRIVESRDMRQHQIVVKRGGRDYVITINGNPRAAQALNGQTNPDNDMSGAIGAILRAGENINRQLSAFYTTRNPDFIVSNFMRDMLYTNTMTWIRESPNYALRFHRNYMYANPVRIKQLLAKHRKGTLDMSNKTEAMFHQFMMNGGETGYANIRDIEQHKNDIRRELKKSNGKIPVKKAWDLLGERFDEYNRAVENCARFAAFMTSREMGRSIDRAIYDAKEISVNFNKKGSGAKFYDSTGQTKAGNASALVSGLGRSGYVFWNAAIQGTANFGRQMKRHPAKAFTGIAAMFLLGAIVAYLGGDDDDDDDKNAYYNLPEYVRRSNILFRAGNSWVSIPLPVEYRAVYGMGELMISVLNGKEHLTGEEIAEAITGQATQILPIDFLEGGGGLNAFVPSAYKPLWEAYVAEKSWTGMPLYKDTPYNKDMPEWTKAYKSANKYIVGLANAMNEATGGDPYTKGTIDFNPAKIEYMLNGYFGGVFGTIDKLSKTAETITDNREYDPRSFLLVNRLVKAGDERTEYRAVNNEYFRLKEEHDRLKSRLKHYEEDTDNDIFDYAEKIDFLYNSPEYERYEIFEDYRRDIDDLYNELNDTVDDEERKNIEAELNELKKEMIEEMNKTRK